MQGVLVGFKAILGVDNSKRIHKSKFVQTSVLNLKLENFSPKKKKIKHHPHHTPNKKGHKAMKKIYKSRFIDTKNNNQSIIGKNVCIILMVKQIGV